MRHISSTRTLPNPQEATSRMGNPNQREADDNRARQRSFLDEESKIASITGNAIKNFNEQNILKPDGSNVQEWTEALGVFAFQRFQDKFLFTPAEGKFIDPYHEQIARLVLHSSVHSSLAYNLLDLNSSAEAYDHLVSKFRIINRAKQIQAWETLKKINLSDYNSSAEAIVAFDRCTWTFVEQEIAFTWDNVISLIMQSNLRDHMRNPVDRKVDLFMETHDFEIPASGDVLRFWDAARVEHKLAEDGGTGDTSVANVELASRSTSSVSGSVSGIVSGPQDEATVTALAVTKTPYCFICKRPDHMSPNCPHSRKNTSNPRPIPSQPGTQPAFPPCSITYNFDKIPYIKPIQPDPKPTGPPAGQPRSSRPPQNTTSVPQQNNKHVDIRQI
ncbi:hypothetical protein PTTG_00968, partial [Puccinia triticina 1-1 BBBD Race 1]